MVALLVHGLLTRVHEIGVVPWALVDDVSPRWIGSKPGQVSQLWAAAAWFREGVEDLGISI